MELFDIVAINDVTIQSFDFNSNQNKCEVGDVEVYVKAVGYLQLEWVICLGFLREFYLILIKQIRP